MLPFGLISLPHYENGSWWYISPISGSLIRSAVPPPFGGGALPQKVIKALSLCDEPYKCNWDPMFASGFCSDKLAQIESKLRWLGNGNFLLSIIYSSFSNELFDDTKTAFGAISKLPSFVDRRSDQCFLRSLLAAKTSRSFVEDGVFFVGAELSSGEMHAWILESDSQPDHEDRSWVNYRPLLAWMRS